MPGRSVRNYLVKQEVDGRGGWPGMRSPQLFNMNSPSFCVTGEKNDSARRTKWTIKQPDRRQVWIVNDALRSITRFL